MRAAAILVLGAVVLTGCGVVDRLDIGFGSGRVRGDITVPYRAVLTVESPDKRDFTVSTKEVAVPLAELRESVRYPATRHCIQTFGASDVDWALDASTGDFASVTDGTERVFSGRCLAR